MSETTEEPRQPAADEPGHGMTLIVKTITRLLAGFILLYGLYVVIYGHLSPGGGFAGGVVLGCGLILVVLAFGRRFVVQFVSERGAGLWDSAGALAFLGIAVLGYLAGQFFQNFLHPGEPFQLFSGGTIPLSNVAIGIKVSACLFVVFVVLAAFKMNGSGETEAPGGSEERPRQGDRDAA